VWTRPRLIRYVDPVDPLHSVEIRVLGCLLEKDITTPEYYPLTVNALVNACNQKSSREPVVHYNDSDVEQALALLQSRGLATRLSGPGHRVEKFGHRLGEKLNLGRREVALLCVLMLRGPQTIGELRGRTERMHDFADLDEVTRVLESLASREPEPLVREGSRGRWLHLLGDPAEAEEPAPSGRTAPSHPALEERVAALEREVAELRESLENLRRQFE
jgi:uncharacterized protein YceH (UPF0502 family)